jgi:GT2 family glycosyltransferase
MDLSGELLVIIPFKDRWDLTSDCLKTLNDQVVPRDLSIRVVLVDNGSVTSETAQGIKGAAESYPHLKMENLRADYPFNFSKLNNDAFKAFRTEKTKWVLFLNNDVSLNDQTIVSRMVSCLESVPEAGAVGCTLLYPDRRIQHIFAAPGVKIIAAHPLKGVPYNHEHAWFQKSARPVAAVTGAVMTLRAKDFEAAQMFDENLPTMGQDIVLSCMVSQMLSKFNLAIHSAGVIHHESPSRERAFPVAEIHNVYQRYNPAIFSSDYYAQVFSRWSEPPIYGSINEPPYPVFKVI